MYEIPRYLNSPLKYVGMELEEILLLYFSAAYAFMVKSWLYFFILFFISVLFIKVKRGNAPGYFKHKLYTLSLYNLNYYPESIRKTFIE